MKNVAWFTTIGTSAPAVYNTIWAAYHEKKLFPEYIWLFRLIPESTNARVKGKIDKSFEEFMKWLDIFAKHTGGDPKLKTPQFNETDYRKFAKKYRRIFKTNKGIPRVIDITPGRKFASAIGLKIGLEVNAASIFYLHLLDSRYLTYSYPEIPRSVLRLVDFKEDL